MTITSDDLTAQARAERESLEASARRDAEKAFAYQSVAANTRREAANRAVVEQFLAEYPGVPLDELITLAEGRVHEAEAAEAEAQAEVERVQQGVDRCQEDMRDLEGHLRVLRRMAEQETTRDGPG